MQLTLIPTENPFSIGTDTLAKKATDLIKLLKSWGIEGNPRRSGLMEVQITLSGIQKDLLLYYDPDTDAFLLEGMVAIVEAVDIDEDDLYSDLIPLAVIDDYFFDLDCY